MNLLKTTLSILLVTFFMTSLSTAAADNKTIGLNVGYARTVLDFEDSGENRSDGLFVALDWEWEAGVLVRFSLSRSEDKAITFGDLDSDGQLDAVGIPFETTVTRVDAVAGYRWNQDGTARPHIYGGLSQLNIQEDVNGVETIDDDSNSLVVGFGLIVGSEHHWFTFDFVNDIEHEADFKLGSGDFTFDYRELRVGWMYRW